MCECELNHEYLIRICPSLVCVLVVFFLLLKRRRWNKHARRPCGVVNALNWTEREEMKNRDIAFALYRDSSHITLNTELDSKEHTNREKTRSHACPFIFIIFISFPKP